ncbi:sugar ABC transporter substrate-binding protein [Mobilicoccus caccae]|uniref:Sugar ABC transporter substrate-binding protein n=1 Tax=Mobilicoccus caccae TaxID=1859295 RepID=A0ABQ6IUZ3_9MICO|nr:sugar ABC transporter substrate-binding protein [Mobilicoccus caccae]GMA41712.1 sugar ABC transporter substrate-binding protein [Mobilicoccus caccae]
MKHGLKLASVALVVALAGCGTTATPPAAPGGGGGTGGAAEPAAGATVTYAPEEVVKPKDGKNLRIGVAFPVLDQFLQNVADGMQARAKEAGVTLTIVSAQEKTDVQLGQVENFISQGVDGIIILPQDTDAAQPMTDAVTAAKIPLVYVNRRPATLDPSVPYVGSDSKVAGQLQMEALAEQLGNKGNIAILQGDPSQEAAQMRTQGCKDVIAQHPEMKVIREQAGNWYRDKGLSITENWIQSGDQIDAICSNNDEMALGALEALRAAGKLDAVKVGGVDATKDALASMKNGQLDITVFQDAKGQGAGGVDSVIKKYNGDEVASFVNVPYELVTPENMAEYANK